MDYIPSFRDQLQNGSEPSWRDELHSELYHYGVKGMKWDPSKLTAKSNSGTWFDIIRKKQLQNRVQNLKQKAIQRLQLKAAKKKNGVVATATKTNSVSSKAPVSSNQVSSKAPMSSNQISGNARVKAPSKKVSDAINKSMNTARAQYIAKNGPKAFEQKSSSSSVRLIKNPYYNPAYAKKTEAEYLAEFDKDPDAFMKKYGLKDKTKQVRATNKRTV